MPFRYPPVRWGSRFGKRYEPSLLYGSLDSKTLLYESAYYRFLFWYGMSTPPRSKLDTQHTMFGAEYGTDHGLRLQATPFIEHRAALTSPSISLTTWLCELTGERVRFLAVRGKAKPDFPIGQFLVGSKLTLPVTLLQD